MADKHPLLVRVGEIVERALADDSGDREIGARYQVLPLDLGAGFTIATPIEHGPGCLDAEPAVCHIRCDLAQAEAGGLQEPPQRWLARRTAGQPRTEAPVRTRPAATGSAGQHASGTVPVIHADRPSSVPIRQRYGGHGTRR